MTKNNSSLLWEIKRHEEATPNYLFGTMHVRDQRAFKGIDFVLDCLHASTVFAAEYNLADVDPNIFAEKVKLAPGLSLDTLLSKQVYKKLANVVNKVTGLQLEQFNYTSPLMLFQIVSENLLLQEQELLLDSFLYREALAQSKRIEGLESIENHLGVFDKLDIYSQLDGLKKIATNLGGYQRGLKKTCELYFKRDISGLLKKIQKSTGGMRKVLLYDRNIEMADSFEKIAQKETLFAAIGAGHLAGSKGVLRKLKKKGFIVKPVYY